MKCFGLYDQYNIVAFQMLEFVQKYIQVMNLCKKYTQAIIYFDIDLSTLHSLLLNHYPGNVHATCKYAECIEMQRGWQIICSLSLDSHKKKITSIVLIRT